MRLSKAFIPTLKEVPSDAVIPSHILMVRSGMVRMLSAGIYSFLPLGYKVIKKISDIVREEMDAIGGQEFHLPALNPRVCRIRARIGARMRVRGPGRFGWSDAKPRWEASHDVTCIEYPPCR